MGDKAPADKTKEKKKKKSVVKLSDLPIKVREKDAYKDDEAPPEIFRAAETPLGQLGYRKKSTDVDPSAPGEPGNDAVAPAAAPAAVNGIPEEAPTPEDDAERTDVEESRKTSLGVLPEAHNGDESYDHGDVNGEVEATAGDNEEHSEKGTTPKRRESESVQRREEKRQQRKVDFLKELDEEKLTELKELFELLDLNQDGFIDFPDLKMTFATLGKDDVTDEELKAMLSEAANPMDFDAFVILLGFKTIALDPEETLRKALSTWDYKDSGMISEERIKHDLQTWGDKFNDVEAEGAFEDAPTFITNGQRMIDYIKFCKTLGGLRKKN